MSYRPDRPLMIQSDMTVLVETAHPVYEQIRHRLSAFAELEKTSEHIHTYRITPLSLWNAASAGTQLDNRSIKASSLRTIPKRLKRWYESRISAAHWGRYRICCTFRAA